MKNQIVLPFLFFCLLNFAQEKIEFIDYVSVYEGVDESSEKGEFEKTLKYLNKISKNDSTYCSVLVSKSYYLMELKKYDETIEVTDHGLNSPCYDTHSSFFINKTVALLNQKKFQDAIEVCNEGLKSFPQNKTLLYNKGVSLEETGQIEEAVKIYQNVITIDPFYRKPYLQLGNICYKQELISQALMCYNMYLLIEPDADNAFAVLKSLNSTVQSKNQNSKNPDFKVSVDDESFEEIDLIINNKIALSEKYDTGNEINIALTKQNHVLLESLKSFSGNGGFWDDKFTKYYQWINTNNFFDIFTYTISYSIENEAYKKVVTKKEKEIIEFFQLSNEKWSEIVSTKSIQGKDNNESLTYFFEDGYVKGIGKMEGDSFRGSWQLYNDQGRLTGKGVFNSNGNRDGNWILYNSQGGIRESAQYLDGKLNGANIYYYDNGRQKIVSNYKSDNLEGEYLSYNKNGALQEKKYFKDGKLDGLYQAYHNVGEELLKSQAIYTKGNIKERYQNYAPTGKISSIVNFKDGKANGQETQYYLNEELSLDLNSKNGLVDGYYKKFHSNGNPKEVGQTLAGDYVGSWKTFYSNNTLESDFKYNDKGEVDGEYRYYDIDGKLNYIFEYRKGEFIAYKYYNKAGEVIHENRKKGGEFYYKGFSPFGKIASEGLYDIKGGKKGKWKYYSSYGTITDEGVYENNILQGDYKTYYAHGQLESISKYKNDTLNGYYVNYHKNGQMKRQGWYKNNDAHGEWRGYNPGGTLISINFFHKGLLHGEQSTFSGKGIRIKTSEYKYGDEVKESFYNKDGNILYSISYQSDKKKYEVTFKHYNKKPSTSLTYVNGVRHGPYSFHDFYGKKRTTGQYLNGNLHGKWIWYHENGTMETKANYINGEMDGDYIYYFEDGTIDSKYFYSLGKLQKEAISYHENGTVRTKSEYYDNKLNGRRESYSSNGKLQLVRFYEYGRLVGYSYLDTNSKELPMIPIENETGKIIAYYDNKKVSRELEYKHGELMNSYKEYYDSGQLREIIHYANGEYDGKRTVYFPDGTIKKEQVYELGNLNGITKEYFENGNLKKEETYLHDIKEGVYKKYDTNGKLLIEETYSNGDIIYSEPK